MGVMRPSEPPRGVWSEEEMRELKPEAPAARRPVASRAGLVRAEVSARGMALGRAHELTRGASPSVVFAPGAEAHGNFIAASYHRILANPAWARRLRKAHTAKRQARPVGAEEEVRAWRELDAATSSDALLMNVFCYPRVLGSAGLRGLLGVDAANAIEFGVRASATLARGHVDRTEIDMRVGDLLVEAKLTETDFQCAPLRLLERYTAFDEVFDRELLEVTARGVRSYQLVRGVLAAQASGARFAVFCDARRTDLQEEWFGVMRAVRSFEMQARLRLVTWQEIARFVPKRLRVFLEGKYGISAG